MILADSAAVTYGSSGGWWMQDAVISKPINHSSLPGRRWVELGVFAFLVRLGERTHDYLRFEIFLEGAGGFKNEDQDKD
jgi:hypothetical protein